MKLSNSSISMYLRCPAQYYFRYVLNYVIPPKVVLIKGSAVHKGQEINYKQKIDSHEDLKTSDVMEVVADEFTKLVSDVEVAPDEDVGKELDEAVGMGKAYHEEIAKTVQPLAVEQEIRIQHNDFTLQGYIDVIEEGGIIRDTKTKTRLPEQSEVDKDLQLSAYAYLYRSALEVKEKGIRLDCILRGGKKVKPSTNTITTYRDDSDVERYRKIAEKVHEAIRNEMFYPNHHEGWVCSPAYCGYWKECHKLF